MGDVLDVETLAVNLPQVGRQRPGQAPPSCDPRPPGGGAGCYWRNAQGKRSVINISGRDAALTR
ncbi:MAG: hypothetical protein ABI661_11685, partial [Gammaproteobacteria bacterium]